MMAMKRTVRIRGEDIELTQASGAANETTSEEDLRYASEVYRKAHDIVSPSELKEFRARLGISGKDFAALMGFSQTTVVMYEKGALPTENNNVQLKASIADKNFLRHFYEQNQDKLTVKARRKVAEYLDTYQFLEDAAWL